MIWFCMFVVVEAYRLAHGEDYRAPESYSEV